MAGEIRVTLDGPVARVALDRPEARNAFGPRMIAELTDAFRALGAERRTRVVVVSGAGKVFSAGADIAYMQEMASYGRDENLDDARRLARLFLQVRDCPKPVVARVHGAALGGGLGLVAACDIAVAAEDTVFGFTEARLGILPAVISPFVVPRIGASAARELFLTGERFDAARAREIGLVARVVPEGSLDAAIGERIEALLAAGPEAQAAVKRLLPALAGWSDLLLEHAANVIADRRASAEGREGLAAFLERRQPGWAAGASASTDGDAA